MDGRAHDSRNEFRVACEQPLAATQVKCRKRFSWFLKKGIYKYAWMFLLLNVDAAESRQRHVHINYWRKLNGFISRKKS